MGKWWSNKEVEILKSNINKDYITLRNLLPNRTLSSILTKKDRLGLKRKSDIYWSDKEDNYLIKNFHKKTINELSEKLGRTWNSIHRRRIRLIEKGFKFQDKKSFFSKYWKEQYKRNKKLIDKHKVAMKSLWADESYRKRQADSIRENFKNPDFFKNHKDRFMKMRISKTFREKQSKIASKIMKERHSNIEDHKRILSYLRKNPSNQQVFLLKLLKTVYGDKNVGCNDWDILDNLMEVDIPIYPLKTAIEWDGEYWHSKVVGVKKKDERKNKELIKRGWKVIRILARSTPPLSNNEINDGLPKILSAINSNKRYNYLTIGTNFRR